VATQPYYATGTTDSSGNLVLSFSDRVVQGEIGVGTVNIPFLPADALYTVLINGVAVAGNQGHTPCGPFVIKGGEALQLVAFFGFGSNIPYTAVWWADIGPQESPVATRAWPLPVAPATVQVLGAITANQGLPNTAANAWPVYIPLTNPPPLPVLPTTPVLDTVQMTGSAIQLAGTLINGAILEAYEPNVDPIWVGLAGVTVGPGGGGFPVFPGASQPVAVSDLSTYWVIGTASDYLFVNGS